MENALNGNIFYSETIQIEEGFEIRFYGRDDEDTILLNSLSLINGEDFRWLQRYGFKDFYSRREQIMGTFRNQAIDVFTRKRNTILSQNQSK